MRGDIAEFLADTDQHFFRIAWRDTRCVRNAFHRSARQYVFEHRFLRGIKAFQQGLDEKTQ